MEVLKSTRTRWPSRDDNYKRTSWATSLFQVVTNFMKDVGTSTCSCYPCSIILLLALPSWLYSTITCWDIFINDGVTFVFPVLVFAVIMHECLWKETFIAIVEYSWAIVLPLYEFVIYPLFNRVISPIKTSLLPVVAVVLQITLAVSLMLIELMARRISLIHDGNSTIHCVDEGALSSSIDYRWLPVQCSDCIARTSSAETQKWRQNYNHACTRKHLLTQNPQLCHQVSVS